MSLFELDWILYILYKSSLYIVAIALTLWQKLYQLSNEKSCLVTHAFEHIFLAALKSYEKVKREIAKCSVRYFMQSI